VYFKVSCKGVKMWFSNIIVQKKAMPKKQVQLFPTFKKKLLSLINFIITTQVIVKSLCKEKKKEGGVYHVKIDPYRLNYRPLQ